MFRPPYSGHGAPRTHQGAPLSLFVVTGRNRVFGAAEIGRFLAPSPHAAIGRARQLRPELVGGLQLEARHA